MGNKRLHRRGIVVLFWAVCAFGMIYKGKADAQGRPPSEQDMRSLASLTPAQRRALRVNATVRAVWRARSSVVAIATNTTGGSGVVVHPKGYVVTNEHVVARATKILVRLNDGRVLNAKIVGAAKQFDVAVLKLDTSARLPVAVMGRSSDLYQGETVIAIGTPFGLTTTVSKGVISAFRYNIQVKDTHYSEFIQTDAAVNPGNSGGPLVNVLGEVIAINTAVHRGGPGISFAIPIDRVKAVLNDLLQYGYVRGIYLGFTIESRANQVVVKTVDPGGPAAMAGIRPNDVLVEVLSEKVKSIRTVRSVLSSVVAGQKIVIRLRRGKVTLVPIMLTPARARWLLERRLGITMDSASRHASQMGLSTGVGTVILSVRPGSPASRYGLRRGDVIIQAERYLIKHVGHMNYVAARMGFQGKLYFKFRRGHELLQVTVYF